MPGKVRTAGRAIGGLLVLITLSCAAPPRGDPPAWSAPEAGMRCRLSAEAGEVPQGAEAVFHLHLDFDGTAGGLVLDRHLEPRRVRLTFTDVETRETCRRVPEDGTLGMPSPRRPEDLVELSRGPLEPGRLPVRLLTRKGHQLPAGNYEVVAVYENDGTSAGRSGSGAKLWKGRLVSPPIPLRVTPASPCEEEHEIPTRIGFARDDRGLGTFEAAEALRRIRITVRPGYLVGSTVDYRISVGGEADSEFGHMVMGGVVRSSPGSRTYLPAELVARAVAGQELAITADVDVFETSIPGEHFWSPESGDYRVLWRGRMKGTLPEGPRPGWDRPVRGLRCRLRRSSAETVVLAIRNVSGKPIEIRSAIHREALVLLTPDGAFHRTRLTAEPEGIREKPLVIPPDGAHEITKNVGALLAAARGGAPGTVRLTWQGWLICGDGGSNYDLHVSNPIELDAPVRGPEADGPTKAE